MTHKSLTFVVHGVGEQPKSSPLKSVVENFLPLIRRRLDRQATVEASPLDDPGPAQATFRFTPEGTDQQYEARFVEVWWANAFSAPALGPLILGGIVAFWHRWQRSGAPASNALTYIVRLLGEAVATFVFSVLACVAGLVLILPAFLLSLVALFPRSRVWTPLVASLHEGLLARVAKCQTLIVEAAVLLLSPVIAALVIVLWLLESAPRFALVSTVADVHRFLVNILTRQFGDMWVYLYQPWEASRITMRFEEEFAREVAGLTAVESVMIAAHSMGTVVCYEALTSDRLRGLVTRAFGRPDLPALTLVTVGSALNLTWDTAPNSERFRFERPLPAPAGWLNIWSEYDPVGSEPLRVPSMTWQSRPAPSEVAEGLSTPLQQRGVVNQMDLFSDHTAYWNNAEEVLAPMLDRLTNYALSDRLNMNIPARRVRVRILAGFKALAWLIGPLVFALSVWHWARTQVDRLAGLLPHQAGDALDWILDRIPALTPDPVEKAVRSVWDALADVVGVSLLESTVVALIAVVTYSTVVKWAWDYWDQSTKYGEAAEGQRI